MLEGSGGSFQSVVVLCEGVNILMVILMFGSDFRVHVP